MIDIKNSQFYKDIEKSEKILDNLQKILLDIKNNLDENKKYEAFQISLDYVKESEKLTNKARLMPISSGYVNALECVEDVILKNNDTVIDYLDEGVFYMKIPALLPKKESGNPSYIRATTKYALDNYFKENDKRVIEDKSTIVIKHNYSKDRSYREFRDHDNIEINSIVDLIALYVLIDDSPRMCDHYYLSSLSQNDNTEIFVVPDKIFNSFIQKIKEGQKI